MADRTGSATALRARPGRPKHGHIVPVAVFAMLLFVVAACSDDNVAQGERAVVPTPVAAPSGAGPRGEALTLEVVDGGATTGLIITDHRGFVVYGVAGETVTSELVCTGDCLDVWIPLTPRDMAVASDLNIDLYGVYQRSDGIEQASYSDIPLYLWTGDRQVGITGGANVAGIWYALTETGGFLSR